MPPRRAAGVAGAALCGAALHASHAGVAFDAALAAPPRQAVKPAQVSVSPGAGAAEAAGTAAGASPWAALPSGAGLCSLAAASAAAALTPAARRRGAALRSRVAAHAQIKLRPGEKVVGIDLGTTNSVVAAYEAGEARVIPNAEGSRTTPSVVAWDKSSNLLVGQIAKQQAAVNPENTFYSTKRFVGRTPAEVADETREVSYNVETSGTQVQIICRQLAKKLAPEEISAQILRKLALDAGVFLNAEVNKAVITVPAYFNDGQRQATKDAGTIAGLEVLRIINEPTAASLAYGLEKKANETIMVFDLGGGTFDVSVLVVGDGVCEVLATSGDTHLGGDDFDKRIVDWMAGNFRQMHGVDLLADRQALQRLTEAAEKAKCELSTLQEVQISLPFIAVGEDGPMSIEETLTRPQFEDLVKDLLDRCREPVKMALKDADLTAKDLDEIVLVGGSTRMRAVQALVRELSGGKAANQSVNPDEVVAIGAAVQAGVLTGEIRDLVLIDVIPLSLSIATHDGLCSTFIKRNTRVPVKKTKTFSTAKDNQPRVEVKVVQGERKMAKQNKELGLFLLTGIPPAPSGIPQIEVTFDVDSNGILSVQAMDNFSKKEQVVTITGSSTLAPEDVAEKVADAERVAADEAAMQGVLKVKNVAESTCFNLERCIRDRKEKIKKSKIEMIESKVLLLRTEIARTELDIPLVEAVTEDLQDELKKIVGTKVTEMYDYREGFAAPSEEEMKKARAAAGDMPL